MTTAFADPMLYGAAPDGDFLSAVLDLDATAMETDESEVMLVYHQLQEPHSQFCSFDVAGAFDTLGCEAPATLAHPPLDEVLAVPPQHAMPAPQMQAQAPPTRARVTRGRKAEVKAEWVDEDDSMGSSPMPSTDEERAPVSYDNVRSFHDLSDEQIANIDFKELTRLMAEAQLTDEQIAEAKARRRRLKNRHSARVCSNKKREKCSELSATNKTLHTRIRTLEQENASLLSANTQLADANAVLQKTATARAQEAAQLRAQVQHLAHLLAQAGLFAEDDAAALAA